MMLRIQLFYEQIVATAQDNNESDQVQLSKWIIIKHNLEMNLGGISCGNIDRVPCRSKPFISKLSRIWTDQSNWVWSNLYDSFIADT